MNKEELCEYLKWDSEFFGLRIARLLPSRLSSEISKIAERVCRVENIDCLYFLADANDSTTARIAESVGFNMADFRITLNRAISREIAEGRLKTADGLVRPAAQEDLEDLCIIARRSHRDSRFYFDANFAPERCDLLYETWIRRSFASLLETVFVAEYQQRASGYLTCKRLDEHTGQIGLFAIDGPAQNLGFGSALVSRALRWFRDQGIGEVEVVTQGRNVAAQRCYQRWGFLTQEVQVWYHWWPKCSRPCTTLSSALI